MGDWHSKRRGLEGREVMLGVLVGWPRFWAGGWEGLTSPALASVAGALCDRVTELG